MENVSFERLYVLLRPCARGGGGYARLELSRGRPMLTASVQGLSSQEEGIRALMTARDAQGGSAVFDLGLMTVNRQGQAALKKELPLMPGGLPLGRYEAFCIAKDWPTPRLLLLGTMHADKPASHYLMEETVRRYLTVPVVAEDQEQAAQSALEKSNTPAIQVLPPVPQSPQDKDHPSSAPKDDPPSDPVSAFPSEVAQIQLAAELMELEAKEKQEENDKAINKEKENKEAENQEEASGQAVMTEAVEPVEMPAMALPTRVPVTALPVLKWPQEVKELEGYFSNNPPFAPFDAPGWRFVQIPMAKGSTIPYYAVGMLARDGRVTQVAYAVPGERGSLPPAGLSGYRWQEGRNGQGYWTLWKKA